MLEYRDEREGMLSGRNCLITGVVGGFGRHLSRAFWEAGASLCLSSRNREKLNGLQDELSKTARADQRLFILPADLSKPEQVRALADEVIERFGHLTALVNNAARQCPIGLLWKTDFFQWENTLRLNLLAPLKLCAAFIPSMMKKVYGKVINLSGGGAAGPSSQLWRLRGRQGGPCTAF